jgi:transcriptional regulator with PAS, ATPase and Fis domain
MSKLRLIESTSQHVVSAIETAMGVDVGIIDTNFKLIAKSKTFLEKRGTDINAKFVKQILDKKAVIVPNPGFNKFCKGCSREGNCPETAEVLRTIRYNGETIGVILIVAYTETQKEKIISNSTGLLEFIKELSKLLCNEIRLKDHIAKEKVLRSHLETTIDFMDNGIISINKAGIITQINDHAAKILKVNKFSILGKNLDGLMPYHFFSSLIEEGRAIRKQEIMVSTPNRIHLLISGNPVTVKGKTVGAVISLNDFKELRSAIFDYVGKHIDYTFDDIYGKGNEIKSVKKYAKKIASTDSTILIQGESGTGKELFARAIHHCSNRSAHSFIPVNCAAIPEALLESELFGYDEGAFSGAKKGGKPGKFEMAHEGTIFLDEIGDMPLHMQVKLLRVLQDKIIERVGGIEAIPVDVRVIASTNQDLKKMVKEKNFREDLYFRLNVMPLNIPPLRDRGKDILILANHFLAKYNTKNNKNVNAFTKKALDALINYYWPGNVRELENTVEYSVNIEDGSEITVDSLPPGVLSNPHLIFDKLSLSGKLKEYEKFVIKDVLEYFGNTTEGKQHAADKLGISLPTLYRRIKELNLDSKQFNS